jgi:hypothetical protein
MRGRLNHEKVYLEELIVNAQSYLRWLTTGLLCGAVVLPSIAQEKKEGKSDGKPDEAAMMAQMMELSKPGENHKLLARTVGTWTYKVKMWMNPDPNAAPSESSGTANTKAVLDGRFFVSDHSGKMQMPGPDGKMMDMDFKGMGVEGYDNVKKKFVSTWIDNMGTGIMNSEGTYDAATKTLTYRSELEMMPGMKSKIRMSIKVIDQDHHTMEFYEDRGGTEVKNMEIAYTRKS